MPLYDYECPACGREFEKRVSIQQADDVPCPHCNGTHTKRRLSRISVKGQSTTGGGSAVNVAPAPGGF